MGFLACSASPTNNTPRGGMNKKQVELAAFDLIS